MGSLICSKVVDLAKQIRMRVGYLEFNDEVTKFTLESSSRFFTQEYTTLQSQVRWARCRGCTNYETPLDVALAEFRKTNGKAHNHHILFVTDGHPNRGDCFVSQQIRSARDLGVS